jgi:hypothetical protein
MNAGRVRELMFDLLERLEGGRKKPKEAPAPA